MDTTNIHKRRQIKEIVLNTLNNKIPEPITDKIIDIVLHPPKPKFKKYQSVWCNGKRCMIDDDPRWVLYEDQFHWKYELSYGLGGTSECNALEFQMS